MICRRLPDNTVTIAEDATHSFTAGQFNFADIDGDSLSSIKITIPACHWRA
jgi:hypothetical protein